MSEHSAEKDAYMGWTGCVHCGQALPHDGTDWRKSSRCRLLQRIAEQAWREGAVTALDFATCNEDGITLSLDLEAHPNPYALAHGLGDCGHPDCQRCNGAATRILDDLTPRILPPAEIVGSNEHRRGPCPCGKTHDYGEFL